MAVELPSHLKVCKGRAIACIEHQSKVEHSEAFMLEKNWIACMKGTWDSRDTILEAFCEQRMPCTVLQESGTSIVLAVQAYSSELNSEHCSIDRDVL